jgi:hypothetical protein
MRFGAKPLLFAAIFQLLLTLGCRTGPPPVPVDLSQAGWHLRQGQALWRSKQQAPEIAGEIVLATNQNARAFIEFIKNPLPLLSAEINPGGWHIEFIPEKRSFSGRGRPPRRLLWLQLLRALQDLPPPAGVQFKKAEQGEFHIEDTRTGESITLLLNE